MKVTHRFISALADTGDASKIGSSKWNDAHLVEAEVNEKIANYNLVDTDNGKILRNVGTTQVIFNAPRAVDVADDWYTYLHNRSTGSELNQLIQARPQVGDTIDGSTSGVVLYLEDFRILRKSGANAWETVLYHGGTLDLSTQGSTGIFFWPSRASWVRLELLGGGGPGAAGQSGDNTAPRYGGGGGGGGEYLDMILPPDAAAVNSEIVYEVASETAPGADGDYSGIGPTFYGVATGVFAFGGKQGVAGGNGGDGGGQFLLGEAVGAFAQGRGGTAALSPQAAGPAGSGGGAGLNALGAPFPQDGANNRWGGPGGGSGAGLTVGGVANAGGYGGSPAPYSAPLTAGGALNRGAIGGGAGGDGVRKVFFSGNAGGGGGSDPALAGGAGGKGSYGAGGGGGAAARAPAAGGAGGVGGGGRVRLSYGP